MKHWLRKPYWFDTLIDGKFKRGILNPKSDLSGVVNLPMGAESFGLENQLSVFCAFFCADIH